MSIFSSQLWSKHFNPNLVSHRRISSKKEKEKAAAKRKRKINIEKVVVPSKMGRIEEKEEMGKYTSKNQVPLATNASFAKNLVTGLKNVTFDALNAKFLVILNEIAGTVINKEESDANFVKDNQEDQLFYSCINC